MLGLGRKQDQISKRDEDRKRMVATMNLTRKGVAQVCRYIIMYKCSASAVFSDSRPW